MELRQIPTLLVGCRLRGGRLCQHTVATRKGSVNEIVMFPARIGQRVQPSVLSARLQKRGQTFPAGHSHHSQPSIQLNCVVVSAPAGGAQWNVKGSVNEIVMFL